MLVAAMFCLNLQVVRSCSCPAKKDKAHPSIPRAKLLPGLSLSEVEAFLGVRLCLDSILA